MSFFDLLTEEELEEYSRFPPGSYDKKMNIPLRKEIAKKVEEYLNEIDPDLPPEFKKIYETYPRWKFYMDKNKNTIKRAYGVCRYDDGEYGLHTTSCHIFFTNDTIGGTPISSIETIDDWTDSQKEIIALNNCPGGFFDPLGWMVFVHDE
jgi:hypothetical protein